MHSRGIYTNIMSTITKSVCSREIRLSHIFVLNSMMKLRQICQFLKKISKFRSSRCRERIDLKKESMIHKDTIEKYPGTMEELATEIGDLKYDALAHFLGLLAEKIQTDGDKDKARNRVKLARQLQGCAAHLKASKVSAEKAWVICEPFMK